MNNTSKLHDINNTAQLYGDYIIVLLDRILFLLDKTQIREGDVVAYHKKDYKIIRGELEKLEELLSIFQPSDA